MKTVITFGTFDLFHIGHLNILQRAATLGDRLVVGVSTDELSLAKKNRRPVYPTTDRIKIIEAIRYVDLVFTEYSLEDKSYYIQKYEATVLAMGDDWKGCFDLFRKHCEVVYLPRTLGASTTDTIANVKKYE